VGNCGVSDIEISVHSSSIFSRSAFGGFGDIRAQSEGEAIEGQNKTKGNKEPSIPISHQWGCLVRTLNPYQWNCEYLGFAEGHTRDTINTKFHLFKDLRLPPNVYHLNPKTS